MTPDNNKVQIPRVLLGIIVGAHGVRGQVLIKSFTARPEDISAYGDLEIENGLRQFAVTVERVTRKGVIAFLKGVATRSDAEALKGAELFIRRDQLPVPEPGAFYHSDLVGLRAIDQADQTIGTVAAVHNFGAGDVLEIKLTGCARSKFVPFIEAFVPDVAPASGTIVVRLPHPRDDDDTGTNA